MIEIKANVALAPLTWWKVGGEAEKLALPKNLSELSEALKLAAEEKWPVTILGAGSNVLVSDRGIAGLTLVLRDFSKIESVNSEQGHLKVIALAGTPKAEVTKIFLQQKLAPALFLCGIPGEIGGGVVMNAGVGEAIKPREFQEIVEWIEILRPNGREVELIRFLKRDLTWEYRHCGGWQPGVIVRVALSWPLEPEADLMDRVREATVRRRQKQPLEWPSCGSVFRNPTANKAGALIEQAGLKGFQIGAAQVSEKHANFIINRGGARASDMMAVIRHVQKVVREKFAIELQPEVRFLGHWD